MEDTSRSEEKPWNPEISGARAARGAEFRADMRPMPRHAAYASSKCNLCLAENELAFTRA